MTTTSDRRLVEKRHRTPIVISPNGRVVLERRYLAKDDHGQPVETPEDLVARVAYIRFASVYRAFRDVEDLKEELAALERGRTPTTSSQQLPLLPTEALEGATSRRPRRPRLRAVPGGAKPNTHPEPEATGTKRSRSVG